MVRINIYIIIIIIIIKFISKKKSNQPIVDLIWPEWKREK